ncbi:hypothetical protein [Oleiharenicola lentus]|uniref:hypothetical protein n=1 Tax=Oleiharenicola lentus TaxID=2508720 RepID=UPI003F67C4E2
MKLQVVSIHNRGNFEKEYVLLKALESCDVGRYLLADTSYTADGKVSNKLRHVFWFPDKDVKKGEFVSVWTGPGKNTVGQTDSGVPVHRFFWGLKSSVWNDDGDCAALLEVNTWEFKPAK